MKLIDADKVLEQNFYTLKQYSKEEADAWREGVALVEKSIKNAPTVSWNELRPTAHFVRGNTPVTENGAFCSECGENVCEWNVSAMECHLYCRACGAKLEIPEERFDKS